MLNISLILTLESYGDWLKKTQKEFEIDEYLRLTRLFCNHAKHSKAKDSFVKILTAISLSEKFPLEFKELVIGDNETIQADKLLETIIDFWHKNIMKDKIKNDVGS